MSVICSLGARIFSIEFHNPGWPHRMPEKSLVSSSIIVAHSLCTREDPLAKSLGIFDGSSETSKAYWSFVALSAGQIVGWQPNATTDKSYMSPSRSRVFINSRLMGLKSCSIVFQGVRRPSHVNKNAGGGEKRSGFSWGFFFYPRGSSFFDPWKVPKTAAYGIGNVCFVTKASFRRGSSLHLHWSP